MYIYIYNSATTRQWFGMVCTVTVSTFRREGVGAPPRARLVRYGDHATIHLYIHI